MTPPSAAMQQKGTLMEMITAGFIAAVFTAGLLSFFSPCVLPLLPVYLGYLSGETEAARLNGNTSLLKAFAFVAGIAVSFFILGFGAGALGAFINSSWFFLACGGIIIVFGLHQTGIISIPQLNREKKVTVAFTPGKGLVGAFALGFLFSFGWTPCVGPVLGAVLGISSQQGSALTGGGLLLVYAFGLSLPFAILALGSKHLLGRVRSIYPHLPKIKAAGGILIILMGIWMVWGQIDMVQAGQNAPVTTAEKRRAPMQGLNAPLASLDDFRGKIVYVKFWATWCPLCLAGLEDFSALAAKYADSDDIAVISIVTPGLNGEVGRIDFTAWAKAQNLTFPIYFDDTGALTKEFGVKAYPTSVYLDKDGRLAGQKIGDASNEHVISELSALNAQKEVRQ